MRKAIKMQTARLKAVFCEFEVEKLSLVKASMSQN